MEQVPGPVKDRRAGEAAALAAELHAAYLRGCVGRTLSVLYEQPAGGGLCQGHGENYMTVLAAGENLRNQVRPTRITGVRDGLLLGELAEV